MMFSRVNAFVPSTLLLSCLALVLGVTATPPPAAATPGGDAAQEDRSGERVEPVDEPRFPKPRAGRAAHPVGVTHTPTSKTVTRYGHTTRTLFARPAFGRQGSRWRPL